MTYLHKAAEEEKGGEGGRKGEEDGKGDKTGRQTREETSWHRPVQREDGHSTYTNEGHRRPS